MNVDNRHEKQSGINKKLNQEEASGFELHMIHNLKDLELLLVELCPDCREGANNGASGYDLIMGAIYNAFISDRNDMKVKIFRALVSEIDESGKMVLGNGVTINDTDMEKPFSRLLIEKDLGGH